MTNIKILNQVDVLKDEGGSQVMEIVSFFSSFMQHFSSLPQGGWIVGRKKIIIIKLKTQMDL